MILCFNEYFVTLEKNILGLTMGEARDKGALYSNIGSLLTAGPPSPPPLVMGRTTPEIDPSCCQLLAASAIRSSDRRQTMMVATRSATVLSPFRPSFS